MPAEQQTERWALFYMTALCLVPGCSGERRGGTLPSNPTSGLHTGRAIAAERGFPTC